MSDTTIPDSDELKSKNVTEKLKPNTTSKGENLASTNERKEKESPGYDAEKKSNPEDFEDEDEEMEVLLEVLRLEPDEIDLFEAVESGDVNLANEIIQKMSSETVQQLSKKYNDERDSLFHIAVRRLDEAILEFLFFNVPNVENLVYDILLLAVNESSVSLVQLILQEIDSNVKTRVERGCLPELPRWQNSQFPDHMTPMMLSGIIGNYELITIFGSRGEEIVSKFKHMLTSYKYVQMNRRSCCGECFRCGMTNRPEPVGFDHLAADYQQIHEYQAKCSPEMLCYYANKRRNFDPILKSLEYMTELNEIKMVEIEFLREYEAIITKLKNFAVQLLSKCENPLELDLLLSRKEGYHGAHDKYPRVVMALEMGFKEFVAHPHTQGTLYMEWAGDDWFEWRFLSVPEKFRQFVYRTVFLPLYLMFLCGEQGNSHGKLLASPLSRCIYSCISQLLFIVLCMAEQKLELNQPRFRKPPNKYLEILLVLFVMGQIRALVKVFFTAPNIFFRQAWNWYDSITYAMYCCCFFCWLMVYMRDVEMESHYFERYQPAERLSWTYSDLFMVADCFLAVGTVLASARLLRFVQLHSTIGPIQIALGQMIQNIARFIPLFTIVFSSFALAITGIYAPYVSVAQEDKPKHAWSTHMNTLYQMYWGLYGMTDTSTADMGTWLVTNGTRPDPYHYITAELAGKLLFSVYTLFVTAILFSSMMVAYMVNTFGAIIEDNDMNWKFSRAELWIYFSRASVMPPPLNLVPTVWDIVHFFRTIREVGKDPVRYFLTCNCAACLHSATKFSEKEMEYQEELYHDFIKTLIRRFFQFQSDLVNNAVATMEDTTALNEEIQELQSLITDALSQLDTSTGNRRNGRGGRGGGKSNEGFVNRSSESRKSILHSPNPSEISYSTRNDTSDARDTKPVEDAAPSGKPKVEEQGASLSMTGVIHEKKEDSPTSTTGNTSERRPSVVQSAVLKYAQKLSTGETSVSKDISSPGKLPDRSKGPPVNEFEKSTPSEPYLLANDLPNKRFSESNKAPGKKESRPFITEPAADRLNTVNWENKAKTSSEYTDQAIQTNQGPSITTNEGRNNADESRNNVQGENIAKGYKNIPGKKEAEGKSKKLSSQNQGKPPLPPLPSSPGSPADPVTTSQPKKKPSK